MSARWQDQPERIVRGNMRTSYDRAVRLFAAILVVGLLAALAWSAYHANDRAQKAREVTIYNQGVQDGSYGCDPNDVHDRYLCVP